MTAPLFGLRTFLVLAPALAFAGSVFATQGDALAATAAGDEVVQAHYTSHEYLVAQSKQVNPSHPTYERYWVGQRIVRHGDHCVEEVQSASVTRLTTEGGPVDIPNVSKASSAVGCPQ